MCEEQQYAKDPKADIYELTSDKRWLVLQFRAANYLLISHSMKQSPSSEANRSSASEDIPCILWDPEGSLSHEQDLATCPYPEPHQSSKRSPIYFFKIHFNFIFPSIPRSYKYFLSSDFHTRSLYVPLLSSYVPHAAPITFFWIRLPE